MNGSFREMKKNIVFLTTNEKTTNEQEKLNERFFEIFNAIVFYWANDFNERLFSKKTNETYGKWTTILIKNKIIFERL